MSVNPLIFRAYDIRGIAIATDKFPNVDLTAETAKLIGKGTGTYLQKISGPTLGRALNIVVGRDNRLHSPDLQKAFIEGLLETGCNVTNIGISPTPFMYYSVCKYNFDGGISITASHNPKEYNGIKIVAKNAHSICGDELQEILKIIQKEKFAIPGNDKNAEKGAVPALGKYNEMEVFPEYKEEIKKLVKLERPLKIVVDAGNGTAGKFAPELLRELGCEVTELYCDLDGNFPNHEANPEEYKNVKDMIEKVREIKADLGIAFDGDGDRVGVVDENGHHYEADYLLILLERDLLTRHPGAKIVFDVKASRVLIDDIKKHGGEPIMSKTGHSFIEAEMKKIGAPLAGEVSGHMFFGENYYGFDDAFLAAAKLLEIASRSNNTFSGLFNDVPKIFSTPEFKATCPDEKKFEIVRALTDHFTKLYDCITMDGVRVNFSNTSWGLARASNTSPYLSIRFEAESEKKLKEIMKIMADELKKYPEVNVNF